MSYFKSSDYWGGVTDDTGAHPAASASAPNKMVVPHVRPHSKVDTDAEQSDYNLDKPDIMAYLAVVFSSGLPFIQLQKSHQENIEDPSYCLGLGRSSVLEWHAIKEEEMRWLRRQHSNTNSEIGGTGNRRLIHQVTPDKSGRYIFALKRRVSLDSQKEIEAFRAFKQELRVLCHPHVRTHENIVKAVFVGFEVDRAPMLGLQLAEFGTMRDVLESRRLGVELACELTLDIINGLAALHACGIAHGDMKPDNILVFHHKSRGAVAQLSDFSDSVFVSDIVEGWRPLGGTHEWRAPECYEYEEAIGSRQKFAARYDVFKSDVFSLGLCAHAILVPGDRHAPGLPGRTFLYRHCVETSVGSEEEHQKTVLHLKRSAAGVINNANMWSKRFAGSGRMEFLAQNVALMCLHSDPSHRFIASAFKLGFYLDAVRAGLIKKDSWIARERSQLDAIQDQMVELTHETSIGVESLGLDPNYATDLDNMLASFDMMTFFHPRLKESINFDPEMNRRIESCLEDTLSSFMDRKPDPIPDDSFMDGDFTLDELLSAFQASVTVAGIESPLSPPYKAKKPGVSRAVLAAREFMFSNSYTRTDSAADIAMMLRLTGLLARLGDPISLKFYVHLCLRAGVKLADSHDTPLRIWMAFTSLGGSEAAQMFLRKEDNPLLKKIQAFLHFKQFPGPMGALAERVRAVSMNRETNSITPTLMDQYVRHEMPGRRTVLTGVVPTYFTPLHHAILMHDFTLLVHLIEGAGEDINTLCLRPTGLDTPVFDFGNGEAKTPILLAAWKRDLEIFEFLLATKGVDLKKSTNLGANLLHFDLHPNQVAVPTTKLEALLEETIIVRPRLFPAYLLCQSSAVDAQIMTVRLLLEFYARSICSDNQPISQRLVISSKVWCRVISSDSVALFDYLVSLSICTETGLDDLLNNKALFGNNEALMRAVRCNTPSIFKYLMARVDEGSLKLHLPPGPYQDCLLLRAAARQHYNTDFLIELVRRDSGGDRWDRGQDSLKHAIEDAMSQNHYEAAKFLISLPLSGDIRKEGSHALIAFVQVMAQYPGWASRKDVEVVIKLGPFNFFPFPDDNMSMLHYLAYFRAKRTRLEVSYVDYLVLGNMLEEMSSDMINIRDNAGQTALHYMVWAGDTDGLLMMLHCDKVNATILVGPGKKSEAYHFPENSNCFDMFLIRCEQGITQQLRNKGVREIRLFLQRMRSMFKVLQEYLFENSRSLYAKQYGQGENALEALSSQVEETVAEYGGDHDIEWPKLISRDLRPMWTDKKGETPSLEVL
ncbi:uncharacterized protein PgNI_11590 [Pyricularia grisea]|uniref:Protein kinase domain-containing protein n=1 Tax=Pyricularia grisea TaxID=148305 RepID=A0A6P8AP18_PYRGI|nr:uncharacterized protein PgNI_11590 [Pyricularia grisea]TLD03766.1 hypothetical protein PgNI_11590 [Pyricularia grisea]